MTFHIYSWDALRPLPRSYKRLWSGARSDRNRPLNFVDWTCQTSRPVLLLGLVAGDDELDCAERIDSVLWKAWQPDTRQMSSRI